MKRLTSISLLVLLVLSCASTPAATQYRTIGTVKLAVDTAMGVWADRVIDGKTTPAQEAQVRAAFNAYRSAAITYIDVTTGDSQSVPPDIANAATALLNLLTSFGVKTGGN